MYKAMVFHPDVYNPKLSSVRPLRPEPYKTLNNAIKAIERVGHEGYIQKIGIGQPVWHNVRNLK